MTTFKPNRLQEIAQTNPIWATTVSEFVTRNPEFAPYVQYTPTTLKSALPVKHGLKTVRDFILFYICYAGVNTKNGTKYYNHLRTLSSSTAINNSTFLPPKKRSYLSEAFKLPPTFTISDLDTHKIQGIGVGGISYIKRHFCDLSTLKETVEYSDICFQKGLQKIYNLAKKPNIPTIKAVIATWGDNKCVGNALCFQANAHTSATPYA